MPKFHYYPLIFQKIPNKTLIFTPNNKIYPIYYFTCLTLTNVYFEKSTTVKYFFLKSIAWCFYYFLNSLQTFVWMVYCIVRKKNVVQSYVQNKLVINFWNNLVISMCFEVVNLHIKAYFKFPKTEFMLLISYIKQYKNKNFPQL